MRLSSLAGRPPIGGLLLKSVASGCGGFKIHEDWGASPAIIDTCLSVAQEADLPVALHTDTLNETGYLADTLAATAGRTVHAYHVEGGGGHTDLLKIVEKPHVLTSSTTPTLPLTPATVAELGPMTMTVHRGHGLLDSDREIGPHGSASMRSRPRIASTTSARSASSTPMRWGWAGSPR